MPSSPEAGDVPFVGESRRLLVDGLVAVWDQVVATGYPQWVSLEAPSGWGKTRVATELYAALAATRQPEPRYWPPRITGSPGEPVTSARKRVMPVVEHVPGSVPQWAWWGVTCALRHRVPTVALAQDVAELEAHAAYLEVAWRARNRGSLVAGTARGALSAGAEFGIGAVTDSLVPGFDLVAQLARFSYRTLREAADRRALVADDALVTPDRQDLVRGVTDTLTRLATGGVPVLLFVEDAHDADPALAELLGRLVAAPGAVLLVTTAWPGHLEDNEHVQRAFESYPERLVRVDESGARLPAPFPAGAGLGRLADDALTAIASSTLDATPETLARIVERYPNPLALEVFCSLPALRARARKGRLDLTPEALQRFPPTLVGLYHELWDQLPDEVRRALALATLGIPSAISTHGRTATWNERLMADVVAGLDLPDAAEVAEQLAAAPTAYAWARVVTDTLRSFAEPDQQLVAQEHELGYVDDDERQAVFDALVARVVRDVLADGAGRAPQEVDHAASLVLALHREGFTTDDDALMAATVAALTQLRDLPAEWPTRRELARYAMAAEADPAGWARVATLYAEGLRQLDAEAAVTQARAAVDRTGARLPADHPALLGLQFELAAALSTDGRNEEALEVTAALLEQQRDLGPHHRDVLRARNLQAIDTEVTAGAEAALPLYREVLEARRAALGDRDRATITSMRNLAICLETAERCDEAVAAAEAAVAAGEAALGPTDVETLWAKVIRCRVLLNAGRVMDLVPVLDGVRAQVVEAVSPSHPVAAELWGVLARALAEVGRERDAAQAAELAERATTDAPGAGVREQLAARLARAERTDIAEAPALHEALLADRRRLLGPDDLDTIVSEHAVVRAADVPAEERCARLRDVLARLLAAPVVRPRRHADAILGVREHLVITLRQCDPDAAVVESDALAADVAADPRVEPFLSLRVATHASYARIAAGRVDEGLDRLAQESARIDERLGAHHPLARAVALDLAVELLRAGRAAEAAERAGAVATAVAAHLPAGAPFLLSTIDIYAQALVAAGEPAAGAHGLHAVAVDSLRLAGASHEALDRAERWLDHIVEHGLGLDDALETLELLAAGLDAAPDPTDPRHASLIDQAEGLARQADRADLVAAFQAWTAPAWQRLLLEADPEPRLAATIRCVHAAALGRAGERARARDLLERLREEIHADPDMADVLTWVEEALADVSGGPEG
jgi:tetratricopeptide (TPR) repeat protein